MFGAGGKDDAGRKLLKSSRSVEGVRNQIFFAGEDVFGADDGTQRWINGLLDRWIDEAE